MQSENHSLFVKVMRLSRPHLTRESSYLFNPYLSEPPNLDDESIQSLFEVNELFKLPGSFGNIYLGETFTSYLSISNESSASTTDVSIKVELQTSTQRLAVVDTLSDPLPELKNGKSLEFIVNHEIKELGVHILVCSVNYTNAEGKKFLRKFYKFQVMNPLSVKTKVNYSATGKGIFLEAQIHNLTSSTIHLEKMAFEHNDCFDVIDYNTIATPKLGSGKNEQSKPVKNGEQESVFGNDNMVGSQDTRQYLYRLIPKQPMDLTARNNLALGKLDIIWRSTLGGIGRLQTSQLMRKAVQQEDLEIRILEMPEQIFLETPFEVVIRIKNWKENEFPLLLTVQSENYLSNNHILLSGSTKRECGILEGLSFMDLHLELIALVPGFQSITGLIFRHAKTGEELYSGRIGDLFILHSSGKQL